MPKPVKPGKAPNVQKRIAAGQRQQDNPDSFPVWRFQYLDADFPEKAGWRHLGQDFLMHIIDTLKHLERQPMNQLFQVHVSAKGTATRYGPDVLEKSISNAARRRLINMELEVDHLVRVRVQAVPRVYAFQGQGNVLNLLWWDEHHVVYPTEA